MKLFLILFLPLLCAFWDSARAADDAGTPCSASLDKVWLDLVVVIEASGVISTAALEAKGAQMMTLLEPLNVAQGADSTHTSRVAVVVYGSAATVVLDLKSSSKSSLSATLLHLRDSKIANDTGNDVRRGLQTAFNLLQEQKSFRIPAIILYATTYDPEQEAHLTATQLKQNGVQLMVITYDPLDSVPSPALASLANPGLAFSSSDERIVSLSGAALTGLNCVCPPSTHQLKVYDPTTNSLTVYGDCLYGASTVVDPILAHGTCQPGILVTVTSAEKLALIASKVIPDSLPEQTSFATSANFVNGYWAWVDYGNKLVKFGAFPVMPSDTTGVFGHFQKKDGEWVFEGDAAGRDNARAYVCQQRACDAEHFC